MKVIYRSATGKDPLGDIMMELDDDHSTTPEAAAMRGLEEARSYNRGLDKWQSHVVTIQCGELLLSVVTKKLRSLSGKLPAPAVAQPDLPLGDKKQPSLF